MVFLVTAVFFAAFFIWPVLQILQGGFIDADGNLTLAYLTTLLGDPTYLEGLRNSFLLARQPDAVVWLVRNEPRLRQRLHHRGGRARGNAQSRGQLTHRHELLTGDEVGLADVNGLQIILDGTRRKHRGYNILAKVLKFRLDS